MKKSLITKVLPAILSAVMLASLFTATGYGSVSDVTGDPASSFVPTDKEDIKTENPLLYLNAANGTLSKSFSSEEVTLSRSKSLKLSLNRDGKVDLAWKAVSDPTDGEVMYKLYRCSVGSVVNSNEDEEDELIYDGPELSFTDEADESWIDGNRYRYCVVAYTRHADEESGETETFSSPVRWSTGGDGFKGDDNGIVYISPKKIYANHSEITANQGTKRKLRINFTISNKTRYANIDVPGYWYSTDTSVARVTRSGYVTAASAGSCQIVFVSMNGLTASCDFKVTDSDTAKGSVYVNFGQNYSHCDQILGLKRVVKGNRHRLNGKIVSQYNISKVQIRFYNSNGKRAATYTRRPNTKTFLLQKYATYMPFNKLSYGDKRVKIYVTNGLGTTVVYDDTFTVAKRVSKANWGKAVANLAQTRIGDPYSMSKRGYRNYTDCSYLVIWTYANALDRYMPATAAEQYRYCVRYGKKLKRSQLKPGDLVFFGGPKDNGRYKDVNHVEIYLGEDQTVGALLGGVTRRNTVKPSETESKMYYGRPY